MRNEFSAIIERNMAEHTPVPTPHRAVYGFALFLFFKTLFILYLFWAFVPENIIEEKLGLTYLPDKYFALYIPILVLCALTIFGFFIYPSWNLSMQDNVNDIHTIQDRYSLRRCQYKGNASHSGDRSTIKNCERKVNDGNDDDGPTNMWHRERYCALHRTKAGRNAGPYQTVGAERNIENFCDCMDKTKCLLNKNPNHINLMYDRATVPSVCDIDIVDVCKQLFRKDGS